MPRDRPASSRAETVSTWLIRAVLALIVMRLVEFAPPGITRLRPALLLTIGTLAFVLWQGAAYGRARLLRGTPMFQAAAGYLGWAMLGIPFALWPGGAFETVRAMLVGVLVLVILLLASRRPDALADDIIKTLTVAAVISALYLFMRGVEVVQDRFEIGTSLDPNDAAALFAVTAVFALGLARRATGPRALAWLACAVVLALAIVRTGSRGGTVAILAGLLVLAAGMRGSRRLLYGAMAVAIVAVGWQVAPASYKERMIALATGEQDYNYTAYEGRKQIWTRGWQYYRANPIVGVGAGNFGVAEGDRLEIQGRTGKWSAPHNSYMQAFAEFGTPGGGLFLLLIALAARAGFHSWRPRARPHQHRPEVLAGLVAFGVASYFLTNAYSFMFFTLFALAALLHRAQDDPADSASVPALQGSPEAGAVTRRPRVPVRMPSRAGVGFRARR